MIEATILLCDFAEAINGKLYMMGAGWNVLFAVNQPVNTSIAVLVEVPWDETNRRHQLSVELLTDDGEPVEGQGQPVVARGEFEIGRPPGVKPGSSFNAPFVWTFNSLVLAAGSYAWHVAIDVQPIARRAFVVTFPPGMAPQSEVN